MRMLVVFFDPSIRGVQQAPASRASRH
jgi:hypothetical protein